MFRKSLQALAIVSSLGLLSAFRTSTNPGQKPKLVVGIVVDQMRQEYLLRFYDQFGEGGFKRLMNEGFMARNAHYNYIPTYTGPGATLRCTPGPHRPSMASLLTTGTAVR